MGLVNPYLGFDLSTGKVDDLKRDLLLITPQGAALHYFESVFCFGVGDGLPLHVQRIVRAACAQWRHVVDNVARARAARFAGAGTMVEALECCFCAMAARLACASLVDDGYRE